MKHLKPALIAAVLSLTPLAAGAKAFTKATIIENHRNCLRFLKLPRAQQAPIARKLGVTTQRLVQSCQSTTRMGVEKTWYYEKMYQNYHAQRRGGGGGGSSSSRPYESSPATSGTCFDLSGCAGSSVHVGSKSSCPGGWGSFIADHGGTGCEVR